MITECTQSLGTLTLFIFGVEYLSRVDIFRILLRSSSGLDNYNGAVLWDLRLLHRKMSSQDFQRRIYQKNIPLCIQVYTLARSDLKFRTFLLKVIQFSFFYKYLGHLRHVFQSLQVTCFVQFPQS